MSRAERLARRHGILTSEGNISWKKTALALARELQKQDDKLDPNGPFTFDSARWDWEERDGRLWVRERERDETGGGDAS